MGKMEVLRLRVIDGSRKSILGQLRMEREAIERYEGIEKVEIYISELLKSDLAIHLHWKENELAKEKSEWAEKISKVLRDYGIVHHTIWIHGGNNEH